ncbi:MAG: hypothetical protein AAF092_17835 [Pseudomonadota bacterium]
MVYAVYAGGARLRELLSDIMTELLAPLSEAEQHGLRSSLAKPKAARFG